MRFRNSKKYFQYWFVFRLSCMDYSKNTSLLLKYHEFIYLQFKLWISYKLR